MRVQPHYYRVWQVEPCHQVGEVSRHPCRAIRYLALCQIIGIASDNGLEFRNPYSIGPIQLSEVLTFFLRK